MSESQDKRDESPESDDSSEDVSPMQEEVAAFFVPRALSPISSIKSEDDVSCASNISVAATKGGDTDECDSERSLSVGPEVETSSSNEDPPQNRKFSEEVVTSGTSNPGSSEDQSTSGSPESSVPSSEGLGPVPRTVSTPSVDDISNFSDMSISDRSVTTSVSSVPPDGEDAASNTSILSGPRIPVGQVGSNPVDVSASRFGNLIRPIPLRNREELESVSSDSSIPQFSGVDSEDSGMMDAFQQRQIANRAPVPAELDECLSNECFNPCNLSAFAADELNVRSETVERNLASSERPSTSGEKGQPGASSSGEVPSVSSKDQVLKAMLGSPPLLPPLQTLDNNSNVPANLTGQSHPSLVKADESGKSSKSKGVQTPPQFTSPPKHRKDSPILRSILSSPAKLAGDAGRKAEASQKSGTASTSASGKLSGQSSPAKLPGDGGSKAVGEASQKSGSASTSASGIDSESTSSEGKLAEKKATKRGVPEEEKMDITDDVPALEGSPTKKPFKLVEPLKKTDDTEDGSVPPTIKDPKGSEYDALAKQGKVKGSPAKKASKRGITKQDAQPASVEVNVESVGPSEISGEQGENPIIDAVSPSKKLKHEEPSEPEPSTSSGSVGGAKGTNLEVAKSPSTKERSTRTPRQPKPKVQTPVSERITRSKIKKEKGGKGKDDKEKDDK